MELIHEAQRVVTHVAECLVRKCSDVLPAYENAPAVGHIQASQNVQQGRLARTGCADDGEYLAGGRRKRHAGKNVNGVSRTVGKAFADGLSFNSVLIHNEAPRQDACGRHAKRDRALQSDSWQNLERQWEQCRLRAGQMAWN